MVYLRIIGLIFLGLLFFVQLLTASWYDLVKKTGDKKKTFKHKIICSAVYIASFLLCISISVGFRGIYAILFGIALSLLFIHDITQEQSKTACSIITCILSSLAYTLISTALFYKNNDLFDFAPFSPLVCKAIPVAVALLCILLSFKTKKAPTTIACIYMVINAILLGSALQNSGEGSFQGASCAVIMGSLALVVAAALPIIDTQDKKSLLRTNLYYFGLMFISCSVAVL